MTDEDWKKSIDREMKKCNEIRVRLEEHDKQQQKELDTDRKEILDLYDHKNRIDRELQSKVDHKAFNSLSKCVNTLKTEKKFLPWLAVIISMVVGICALFAFITTGKTEGGEVVQCKNYCCQRLVKSAGEWSGGPEIILHSTTCKKARERAAKHDRSLKFFMSDKVGEIKRQIPGNVKANVVVCPDCRLTRQDDGGDCKAVCCVYYGWIVERPLTAHRQDCRMLKHKELRNLKLVCSICCPDKATLVSKGFHLCPGCFELGPDKPTRKKPRRRRFDKNPPVLAYRLDS